MNQDQLKKSAAQAALSYVTKGGIIGVGTGSTVNFFIELLASMKSSFEAAVASSIATAAKLKALNITVFELNNVDRVDVYIDGADEFNQHHFLVKGGGGALTREKIIATASKKFVCIVDDTKRVDILGKRHPLPIEVIPMARSFVARQLVQLGADPVYREKFITDNGNQILDVYNLKILDPLEMEQQLNNIPGIVENGIFAKRRPEVILLSTSNGIEIFNK